MNYNRLTCKDPCKECLGDMGCCNEQLEKFCYRKRLADLEDKIENGTLVEIPFIQKFDNYYYLFHFDKYGFITCDRVGETEEEAEERLKELNGVA